MLKLQQKRKKTKDVKAAHKESNPAKPVMPRPRPQWNESSTDMDRFKLSQAELIQKKVSLMSKNRTEARESWLIRQDKLQKGIIDEDTQSVIETCSKRPPEKNYKNNTYFIRGEGSDLQSSKSEIEDSLRTSELGVSEDTDGLIVGVDRTLKETRDFIQKFSKEAQKRKTDADPEKLLLAHESIKAKNYESNTEHVVKRSSSRNNTDRELRRKSVTSISKSTCKNNVSKVAVKEKQSEARLHEILNKQDDDDEHDREQDTPENKDDGEDSFERIRKIASKDSDMACYFTSLNRIEDTIKFLEHNIMQSEQNDKQENKVKDVEPLKGSFGGASLRESVKPGTAAKKEFGALDIKDFFEGSPVQKDSDERKSLRDFLSAERRNMSFDMENFEPKATRNSTKAQQYQLSDDHEDDQISFSLTLKSNRSIDLEVESESESKRNSATLAQNEKPIPFGTVYTHNQNVALENNYLRTEQLLIKPFEQQLNSINDVGVPSYGVKNIVKNSVQPNFSKVKENNNNKENEFAYDENEEIERIKQMLKATQEDIQKMNSVSFDFPGQAIKKGESVSTKNLWDADFRSNQENSGINLLNNSGFKLSANPSYGSLGMESVSTLQRNSFKEPTVSVKSQQFNAFLRNPENLPFQDITNQVNHDDEEEAPRPMVFKSRPIPVAHPGSERNSLSIRANLK